LRPPAECTVHGARSSTGHRKWQTLTPLERSPDADPASAASAPSAATRAQRAPSRLAGDLDEGAAAEAEETGEPGPAGDGRLLSRRMMLVMLAVFSYFTGLGALLPTLPRYIKDDLHGGGLAVGAGVGAFAVSAALLRPWTGRLGDLKGRRVLVVGGAATFSVSAVLSTLATSLPILVVARLLSGVGESAVFVGAATAAQDMAPAHRRGEASSYFSVALYAGLAAGPPLGEYLREHHGFNSVWLAVAILTGLASLIGLFVPTGTLTPDHKPEHLLHPAAIGPGALLGVGLLPFVGFSAFMPIYADQIGMHSVGPVLLLYAGLVLLVRIFGARLPDRLGWQRTSTIALVSVSAGAGVLALWPATGAIWLSAVFFAGGMSLLFPALFSATVNATPEHERTQAVGTFSLFFDLANGLGAPFLGLMVSLSSNRGAFAVAAVVAGGALLLQPWVARRVGPAVLGPPPAGVH
jgi:MFS family permease